MSHRKTSNIDPMARGDDAAGTLFAQPKPLAPTPTVVGPERPPFEHRDIQPSGVQQTSVDAYKGSDRDNDRMKVMRLIHTQPRTIDEVAAILAKPPNAVCGRFNELEKESLITKTQMRRKTRSGSTATVWSETGLGCEFVKANQ